MSDNPEWCPDEIWGKVCVLVPSYIDTSSYDLVRIKMTREGVARAIMKSRSDAYDECKNIAERYLKDDLTPTRNPSFVVLDILESIRLQSQAIRQHSQKGRDK